MRALLATLLTLCIPALLVLSGIRLLMTDAYLAIEYNKPDFPPDPYGFSREDRLRLAPVAVQYLLNGEGKDYLNSVLLADGTPPYNDRELQHMVDVKIVVNYAFAAFAGLIGLSAICAIALARTAEGREALRGAMFRGGLILLVLLGSLLFYILIDWDRFFTGFHSLFFAEGSWRFYESDTLIRLFPIRFWQDAAITVGVMSAVGAVALMGLSRIRRREAASHYQLSNQ
jgi:integral membrane protein (TIGR01906 family)